MPGQAASLLDIEPSLGRLLGARTTASIGHQRRLPVFVLEAGEWAPPARDLLGLGTLALVVLEGWLLGANGTRVVLGPGDRLEPWEQTWEWTACTRVRLAVLGEAFTDALDEWPVAATQMRAARRPCHPPLTSIPLLEDRLVDLLWSLARYWGTLDDGGIALPVSMGRGQLALLTAATEPKVAIALTSLRGKGTIARARDGSFIMVAPTEGRRDELRGRMTEQFVLARLAAADHAALSATFEAELRQRDARKRV